MSKIPFLTFHLCALLLLSGCDDLSGFKEIDISQTGISKVCDKKHKLKYPEIVPANTSWIDSLHSPGYQVSTAS